MTACIYLIPLPVPFHNTLLVLSNSSVRAKPSIIMSLKFQNYLLKLAWVEVAMKHDVYGR